MLNEYDDKCLIDFKIENYNSINKDTINSILSYDYKMEKNKNLSWYLKLTLRLPDLNDHFFGLHVLPKFHNCNKNHIKLKVNYKLKYLNKFNKIVKESVFNNILDSDNYKNCGCDDIVRNDLFYETVDNLIFRNFDCTLRVKCLITCTKFDDNIYGIAMHGELIFLGFFDEFFYLN